MNSYITWIRKDNTSKVTVSNERPPQIDYLLISSALTPHYHQPLFVLILFPVTLPITFSSPPLQYRHAIGNVPHFIYIGKVLSPSRKYRPLFQSSPLNRSRHRKHIALINYANTIIGPDDRLFLNSVFTV